MKITQSRSAIFVGILFLIGSALEAKAVVRVVTNTDDSGPGSLRQAVLDANAVATPDTIVFDSTFNSSRTLTLASVIAISPTTTAKKLTITGPGTAHLTISGNNATRIFTIGVADTVSISGLKLTRGNGSNGGAIKNDGILTLTNMSFTENVTNSGGAIYNAGNGTTSGVLHIEGCVFTNNQTTGTNINGDGGSALESRSGIVTINNSIMTGGTTRGGGGAIRNNGGMVITNSTISNNTSGGVGNSDGGGGITSTGQLTLIKCVISNNTAGENTSGGGLDNEGQMTLINTIVTGNTATVNGGGISHDATIEGDFLLIIDSTISNNTANTGVNSIGDGGGIFAETAAKTTLIRSTISGNSSLNSSPTSDAQGDGGGIYSDGEVIMDNCTVTGNHADQNFGGIRVPHNFFDSTITNSTIVNNSAAITGGGVGRDDCGLSCRSFAIGNTIIANNAAPTESDIRNRNLNSHSSPITSLGYNLIGVTGDAVYILLASGDLTGVNPNLGSLQNNGGPTATHALLPGSPAIDQGKSLGGVSDQRGLQRPYDNASTANAIGGDGADIGAFEDQPPNTQPGDDITIQPPSGGVRCTFHSVSQAGFTSFVPIELPSSIGTPPRGYTILDNAPAYDITTTVTFTPPVDVCFTVSSITDETEFARVRMLHQEDGQLIDRTDRVSHDFASRTVCAEVDSLSPFVLALAPAPGLVNISTRLQVLTGDQALIGGFIVTGTEPKKVILRAIGPSLSEFGIANPLADPVLELHAVDGSLIATNDNWTTNQATIEATGLQPTSNLESAIVATLDPGSYTAVVNGKDGGTGVGAVEAYDLDQAAVSELANISTRGLVDTGNNVMIGGFILGSDSNVLIRAIGPSLGDFGVAGALADPTLELHDAQGTLISSNDNWRQPSQNEIEATGLQPLRDEESALHQTLPAGAYTAIVAGQGAGTGVGLVEVYRLQ